MTVYVEFNDGATQESYGVTVITFEGGFVCLDGRKFPLKRIKRLSTKGGS